MLRAYVRQRHRLTRDRARCVQHMQKALTQMNVQLDTVLSDLMGKTGQSILRAMVAGERDGAVLARLRDRRVKADEETIARSLQGNWREEHVFALAQALEHYDFLSAQLERCEARMGATLRTLAPDTALAESAHERQGAPARATRARGLQMALHAVSGVDLTAIPTIGVETALTIASEIGPDLSRFPTREHFCSWLTLAPGTRISGAKPLKGRPAKRNNRAGQALRLAASTARHNQSFIGAAHRARLRRLTPRARSRRRPTNSPGSSTPCSPAARSMWKEASSTSRPNAVTDKSAISSVRPDTSASRWCRSRLLDVSQYHSQ